VVVEVVEPLQPPWRRRPREDRATAATLEEKEEAFGLDLEVEEDAVTEEGPRPHRPL
jgi:hypothetical protein